MQEFTLELHEIKIMTTLLFITGNSNKLKEIASLLPSFITLKSLKDIGFMEEIEENEDTIEGNSMLKVLVVKNIYKGMCFAEDTGLEIEALAGEPGVRSARYAGEGKCNQDNINLVLSKMKGILNRNAQFKTVLTFFDGEKNIQFEGLCKGSILEVQRGDYGFGYDSIFIPNGSTLSFAEMDLPQKNVFSHRKKAFSSFIDYFQKTKISDFSL